ncbi:MAG: alpha/beta fold hydrolase [Frankiales bacterium]|nr:alpha/beta fold hydrolase [Frankiales bacterium]
MLGRGAHVLVTGTATAAAGFGADVFEARGTTRAVILVLHGGKADSYERSEPSHLSSRRLNPFVRVLHRQGSGKGIAVWKVRYRVRGWNGRERSPTQDAQWALDEIGRRHPGAPVVIVAHSMGGRAAVHVLGDPTVVGAVLLCPWLPHEPVDGALGKKILVAHGVVDRWTSPRETRAWADAARPLASRVTYVGVRRTGHFMLRRAGLWTDLAVGPALSWLGANPSVGRTATKVLAEAAAGAPNLTV